MHTKRFLIGVLASPSLAFATPVINEIHYNNNDNTVLNEFVEIHNPGENTVDVGNWSLDGGVRFTIPPGTSIPPGGYLVIAEDPATITSEFAVPALGPYEGRLNSSGELIELLDASGAQRDQVDYGVGFPWPTRAKGEGSSMELINPNLDNDLGSSWRSSGVGFSGTQQVYVTAESNWSYRKGLSEASSPIHDWTRTDFVEDASWLTGQAPFGRSEPLANTNLDDARNNYSSVFLRKTFNLNGQVPSSAILRLIYDDGAIVWLNGTEIFRTSSVDPGIIDYRGNDPSNAGGDGTAIADHEQAGYEEFLIPGTATLFQEGENVLAVQVFNRVSGNSDFLIDAVLESPEPFSDPAPPSPGRANGTTVVAAPPNIRQVNHTPNEPTSQDPVVIRAKVTDPEGVASVTLSYQVVAPGSYIRITDAAYETNWTEVDMTDPDGDDTWSATLPAQDHRHLVRYRITVADTEGSAVIVPFDDDEQPNFAFFVYDGVPEWSGSDRQGVGTPITFPSSLLNEMPVYHLIANSIDVTNCQYNSAFENSRFRGTMVYDGVVYDHIEFKIRGEFSTYRSGKNKWRIFFNPAREFEARDNYGQKYREPWDELNINANASPWAAVNRGMAGLDEALSFKAYQIAGMASPNTNYFHFRVIDESLETSPTDQYRGDLWGLYLAVEQPDGSFLDERDLPPGNVYKIEGGNGDKKHQAPNQPTNGSDWSVFYSQSNNTNTEAWWREHMDIPSYVTFRAVNRAVGNVDLRNGANHYFYHRGLADGTPDKWVVIPWDLDMMLISMGHWSGTIRQERCLNHPAIRVEYQNRCREVMDLMLSDSSPDGGQVGQLVGEFSRLVAPAGQSPDWVTLDRHLWNWHPRTQTGNAQTNHKGSFYRTPYFDSRRGGNWTRTLTSSSFQGSKDYVMQYMTDSDPNPETWSRNSGDQQGYGYNFVSSEANDPNIPDTPMITYSGEAGFPTSGLSFTSSAFSDPQGSSTFGAMEWRIAEIANPSDAAPTYEIESGWESGVLTTFNATLDPPALATRPDRTYRARVRHRDNTGRWSHWSLPVEFSASPPSVQNLQENLVVSEIMYNPAGDDATEFIELFNRGTSTLDLTNVRFTKGIDYDFPAGISLSPGAYLLVVKNTTAFEAKYGNNLPVAPGQYDDDSLSNGGELLKLALGTVAIHEFDFNDDLPWPESPDGDGYSLVLSHTGGNLIDPILDPLGHGIAANWRASSAVDGSPGVSDPTTPFTGTPGNDSDFDDLDDLLEYALGTSASTFNDSPFAISVVAGAASLTFPVDPLADGVIYLPESSTDLVNWTSLENLTSHSPESRTYTLFQPDQKTFFRLRVQQVEAVPR
ncbi:MAG: lamin tail domain-containing protein [Akkermansiaceae bacterium]|jgi:hypothetical protein